MKANLLVFPQPKAVLPQVWATACGSTDAHGSTGLVTGASPRLAVNRPALRVVPKAVKPEEKPAAKPEYAFYRKHTEMLLRRYEQFSLGYGRTSSLLGREVFRARVTSYKVESFDEAVIFVHDVGKCLSRLEPLQRGLVRRIALQGYSQAETADLLRVSKRTVWRRYGEALDQLTEFLIEVRLLEPLGPSR